MQKEKFYKAQVLQNEILQIETALNALTENPVELKVLDKLNVDLKKSLTDKAIEAVKKELQKVIKQKEKEFSDL